MRRGWIFVLAAVVAAAGLLGFPTSFEKTVGWDATLIASAPGLDGDHVVAIQHEVMLLTGAKGSRVETDVVDGVTSYRILAPVDAANGGKARVSLDVLAEALRARGCLSRAEVIPRTQAVRAPLAERLANQWRTRPTGVPSAKLVSAVAAHLAAAGFEQESATLPSGGPPSGSGSAAPSRAADESPRPLPEIALGERSASWTMDVSEDRDGSGARKLVVVLAKSGRSSRVEVPGVDAMSRSALALTLQSQIERAGLDARVRVLEQKIEVEMRDAR